MGSILSYLWPSGSSSEARVTKSSDPKYKQGVGGGGVQKSTPIGGQQQQQKFKSHTVGGGAAAKRKKPKGKVNKDMIGKPGNFQHTAHVGAKDMRGEVDLTKLKQQITGPVVPLSVSAPEATTSSSPISQAGSAEVKPAVDT